MSDGTGDKGYILILGATSDVAKELLGFYARDGYSLYLAGRNREELERTAADIRLRYQVEAKACIFDALKEESAEQLWNSLEPKPEGVICAVGLLGDQQQAQRDPALARRIVDSNFTGLIDILERCAAHFEARQYGFIIGISSVAGDRGRASNYIYGAAKAAFSTYLSGLRNRLAKKQVQVLTVKPGFIRTKMTRHLDLPEKMTASPEDIARGIYRAHHKGKDVVYLPWKWRLIMTIICAIPEFLFKKLSI
ncbi:MAG: SDR family oxidoreductase [Lentisphaerae bacterium]|nr:MAG: SDR family oxidoreductase [Lentisphaerota bacterium]